MQREAESHKGDNGKVAIIGGSGPQHGAPLFSALAAEASGVDLVYLWVPVVHAPVARTYALNIQVYGFGSEKSDEISNKDITAIIEMLASLDCAVIGPGLSRTPKNLKMIKTLIEESPCPLVIDASALQDWTLAAVRGRQHILTPHLGELERMVVTRHEVGDVAKKMKTTILVKGHTDTVASDDGSIVTVEGGNPGLTVGGTGDALAGLVCGLVAQGMKPADACSRASTVIKHAGDELLKTHGFAYTTRQVISKIPSILREL